MNVNLAGQKERLGGGGRGGQDEDVEDSITEQ